MKSSANQPWIVLAAISFMICVAMALPIYGGSVANTYMVVSLGWKKELLGLLVAVNMLVNAAFAPLAAITVGRLGARNTMLAGSFLVALGGLGLATIVTEAWQAVVAFSLLIGIGGAMAGVIPCQAVVAAWFDKRRTMALSVMYAVQGVGGFASVYFVTHAIGVGGSWRSGWWVFVIAGVIGLVIAGLFVRNFPAGAEASAGQPMPPGAEAAQAGDVPDVPFKAALRSPLLWGVCLTMLTLMAGSGFNIAHAQVYIRGLNFTPETAASAFSLLSVAMVIGNIGFGALATRTGLKTAYMTALAIFCVGMALLTQVRDEPTLWAFAVVTGTGFGAGQVGAMAMFGHYWGTRVFPALTALGLIVQTVGGGMVPVLAGRYFDTHGTYLPVIWMLVGVNVLSALMMLLVYWHRASRPTSLKGA